MDKKNCDYEDMTTGKVHEQTEVPMHNEPYENAFEKARNSAFNQSGFEGRK
jgi:hypothetical protein